MDEIEIKKQLTEATHKWLRKAEAIYGRSIDVKISFKLKGRTAGQAHSDTREIRYNLLAAQMDWDHVLNHTVPHEVAHIVQYTVFTRDRKVNPSHGHIWQRIMGHFGVPAKRCHSIPLPKSRIQRRKPYYCGCPSGKTISLTKWNRIAKKGIKYTCQRCNQVVAI